MKLLINLATDLVLDTNHIIEIVPLQINNKCLMSTQILITTSTSLEGYRITKQLGLVRGITVRSRSLVGNIAGGFMTIFGGKSAIYTELCEKARDEALQLMIKHGQELGCNAIINMRYDANDIMSGLTEVLAYGTAVVVERGN